MIGLLYGEYELNLDDKNRLLMPVDFRRSLNPADDSAIFWMKIGPNKRLWIYSRERFGKLAGLVDLGIDPTPEQLRKAQMDFAFTSKLEWDKQGRVVIPEKLLKRAGVGKEVALVGVHDHLELWNKADWEKHTEVLLQDVAETHQAP